MRDPDPEVARLRAALELEASAADRTLNGHPSTLQRPDLSDGLSERRELRRQLAALRESASLASARSDGDPGLLRADLGTLLSFARTLRSDAEAWRTAFEDQLRQAAQRAAAAHAEREALLRQRDALQSMLDQAAQRMAHDAGGECRRTPPCFTLGEALTVCSLKVLCPRRRLRGEQRWLVTLDDRRDEVIVRRSYV